MTESMGAVILAGGRSSRLGRPKQDVVIGDLTLLERTLRACESASTIVVVGPPRDDLPAGVRQAREDPPFAGPAAAVAAALPQVNEPTVLVLACDMPRVADAVAVLRAPAAGFDAVMARDRGRAQPLALRADRAALASALAEVPAEGASMRSVLDRLAVELVDVPDGSLDDVDEPQDLERAADLTVRDAMIADPKTLDGDATVAQVRAFFDNDHVQLAVLVERDSRVVAVVTRDDLAEATSESSPARTLGRWDGRSVAADTPLEPVRQRMVDSRIRRLVVVDDQRRLLGLLCMKRRFHGFCSAEDLAARERERREARA